ncbi:MAG: hypothetical protein DMF24_06745 [Verrucomicrobia bacterium]|nr:MAG: hypothetical protein DMF24_06745 [Verrucomicrobiota bacterium]
MPVSHSDEGLRAGAKPIQRQGGTVAAATPQCVAQVAASPPDYLAPSTFAKATADELAPRPASSFATANL